MKYLSDVTAESTATERHLPWDPIWKFVLGEDTDDDDDDDRDENSSFFSTSCGEGGDLSIQPYSFDESTIPDESVVSAFYVPPPSSQTKTNRTNGSSKYIPTFQNTNPTTSTNTMNTNMNRNRENSKHQYDHIVKAMKLYERKYLEKGKNDELDGKKNVTKQKILVWEDNHHPNQNRDDPPSSSSIPTPGTSSPSLSSSSSYLRHPSSGSNDRKFEEMVRKFSRVTTEPIAIDRSTTSSKNNNNFAGKPFKYHPNSMKELPTGGHTAAKYWATSSRLSRFTNFSSSDSSQDDSLLDHGTVEHPCEDNNNTTIPTNIKNFPWKWETEHVNHYEEDEVNVSSSSISTKNSSSMIRRSSNTIVGKPKRKQQQQQQFFHPSRILRRLRCKSVKESSSSSSGIVHGSGGGFVGGNSIHVKVRNDDPNTTVTAAGSGGGGGGGGGSTRSSIATRSFSESSRL